ncbi:uncharacterized protein PHALS_13124 [Plasmopara halstedii]|uniref:Uncharacterized protein n=1 Tax=Plasmopara halstedii TaxID=4781 RepID=A0A0P1APD9_PLAHL|nr:uncharacterized protein PHALS_13124 [Plasmopara halstedii]CEG42887.1 hypothetical protein PHALS_13124 [Plasmopara halstedii]|eukprot:XP_024579256.1 hypothetical protein PHALS_13124 [Plasmopara halstedii]
MYFVPSVGYLWCLTSESTSPLEVCKQAIMASLLWVVEKLRFQESALVNALIKNTGYE